MKTKFFVALVASILLSYLFREIIGNLLRSNYSYSGSFIGGGNPGNFDGFVISFVFFCTLIVGLATKKVHYGFIAILPILVLDIIIGAINPQLWFSLGATLLGLLAAYLILLIQRKAGSKII